MQTYIRHKKEQASSQNLEDLHCRDQSPCMAWSWDARKQMGLDLPGTYVYGYCPKELNDESVTDYGPNHFVGNKDSDDMLNLMLEKYFYAFGASMRSSTW
jgi:hypothetical protein